MPSWHEILNELKNSGSTHDVIRRKYLQNLHKQTKRNIIVYYSGWLQKQGFPGTEVNDNDKNGFMTVIHNLDRSKGLNLILHTPGGSRYIGLPADDCSIHSYIFGLLSEMCA